MTRNVNADSSASRRDWQKGVIFSILLNSKKSLTIEELDQLYTTEAQKFRDKYGLSDKNFSRAEVYSVLLELVNNNSLRIKDYNAFSLRTDDEGLQDRRIVFDMLQYTLKHEFAYTYDEFAAQFSAHYLEKMGSAMAKDRALSVLSIAIQSNIIGLSIKPGTKITCMGQIPPLYVASTFSIRSNAPLILPFPATLPPCPP